VPLLDVPPLDVPKSPFRFSMSRLCFSSFRRSNLSPLP
jgi:hypothetical protein